MFLVVPQWQGSGSSRAMRLVDGADAIRSDLPKAATNGVNVPLEAGDAQGSGVARCGSLLVVRDRMTDALQRAQEPVITIGGDCGVELGAIGHARTRHPDAAVVWFDAHADLNTPSSSPSGAFHGMVARTILGEGAEALVPAEPLAVDRLVMAGVRALDEAEAEFIDRAGITVLGVDAITPESIVAAVAATGASSVYVHVDLDVLDPAEFAGIGFPEPFGLSAQTLIDCIRALRARFTLAGAGIMEFAPASTDAADDDLPTILRIVAALTS